MADFMVFLRRFFAEPGRVGSIIPSSRFLCEKMLCSVDWNQSDVIIELGPGTGAFTESILKKKRLDTKYILVERDPLFREMLTRRFPGITMWDEALKLQEYMSKAGIGKADAIISGLPFANFPAELRTGILDEVQSALAPGGLFITFQYSLQLKAELQTRFQRVETTFTPLNIPPAFIYTCRDGSVGN
ncbi:MULTISPECIES: class I SAM-dependent methyltransferase [Brevibacillus]|uniref:class I SAM-dependent methyltransferase n=1 Tax=Brevibacillus TaxID=55080 RepID=UPI000468CDC1|nr:rRNA adenine N-6-methyltransferase family protein [Brevibacillus borstelensis]KKX53402.1 phospholipid methyltransferase [Brevibacillus borstelensis cifa_chp40]MBE5396560.1 phospholipid methyltransferase [Brevibacillus borstelensis]MCC0565921.1 phospholipid methyltransferase [Brevibacillus borstelensis]MCM3471677.1 phospholipid methyltransferase [Brevibacillus borstelensis]MCM3557954.1 phospholipid methyltransferase [Brevibacillus borstelensis]